MKKVILCIATTATCFSYVLAQDVKKPNDVLLPSSLAHKAYLISKKHLTDAPVYGTKSSQTSPNLNSFSRKSGQARVASTNATIVGSTTYDLQTNASPARRLINHGDGTFSAVWTLSTATNDPNFNDRGTGYNFFNGTSWGMPNTVRLEGASVRTGWPNLGDLNGPNEFLISHRPDSSTLYQGVNDNVGNPLFQFKTSGATTVCGPAAGKLWARVAISGANHDTIHVISCSDDTLCKANGVSTPFVYSRSTDGGITWGIHDMLLPGYDNTRTLASDGDSYAIDAKGSNVAIVLGGLGEDVTLWKSTDNGNTFTRTLVDSFPQAPSIDYDANLLDTVYTNDGTVTVVLDNNGMAHVAFAVGRVQNNNKIGDGVFEYYPYEVGLTYWNEITQTESSIPMLYTGSTTGSGVDWNGVVDANGNNTFLAGDSTTSQEARYGNSSLLTMPSIATDSAGDVYIVFSLPLDGDTSESSDQEQAFRDIWVVDSMPGQPWSAPLDLTCSYGIEEVYGVTARLVDNNLYIYYMSSNQPGVSVQATEDPVKLKDMVFISVPVAEILNGSAGCLFNDSIYAAIHKIQNNIFSVSDNYPNPFTKQTSITLALSTPSDVTFTVSDIIGRTLSQQFYSDFSTGSHALTFDAGQLKPGIYFYTVKAGTESVTKKMIIE